MLVYFMLGGLLSSRVGFLNGELDEIYETARAGTPSQVASWSIEESLRES